MVVEILPDRRMGQTEADRQTDVQTGIEWRNTHRRQQDGQYRDKSTEKNRT